MAIRLQIEVADIAATLFAGYASIKVYRSSSETTGFSEITTPNTVITLQAGISNYEFLDYGGTPVHWYRTTFYNPDTPAESLFSTSFLGEFFDNNSSLITYPQEAEFAGESIFIIDSVRTILGDRKELVRDYVSADTGYSSISADGRTHSLINPRGWPVSVTLDGDSFTSRYEPTTYDYQFVTFSGTSNVVSTSSGTLDVWYYHFRFSDSEIIRAYNSVSAPYPLTAEDMTFDLLITITAINLLFGEMQGVSSNSGVEIDIFEEIRINPKIGLDSRVNQLKILLAERQRLIDEIIGAAENLFGVRIE